MTSSVFFIIAFEALSIIVLNLPSNYLHTLFVTVTSTQLLYTLLFQGDAYPVADRWSLEDITAVFSRRYLHQSKALEVFFVNKS